MYNILNRVMLTILILILISLTGCDRPTIVQGKGKVKQLKIYADNVIVELKPGVELQEVVNLDFFHGFTPFYGPETDPDHREVSGKDGHSYFSKSEWDLDGGVLTLVEGYQWDGEGGEYEDHEICWKPAPQPRVASLLPSFITKSLKHAHTTVYVSGTQEHLQIDIILGQAQKIIWASR